MARQYKLLGRLEIEDDGRPSALMKYSKGCALLAYLIISKKSHSREAVADLLWEATSTAQSFRSLRALLYKIRPISPELTATPKQLSFQANKGIYIDLYTLESALADNDMARLDGALSLYKGDLLDGFYLDDAPRFWEWTLLEREQLRQRIWDGYFRVCNAYFDQQNWTQGVETARRWLSLDELDDNLHQWLMKFLAANGQKTAAIEQYEKCRQLLLEELGIEPSSATTALYEEIQQIPDEIISAFSLPVQLELPLPGELAEPGGLPPHSFLPYHRNAAFTGRVDDLLNLADLLLPAGQGDTGRLTRTAAVTGMGGLGKSQLAVEYAYRYGRYYPGGVYWLNFGEPENIDELVAGMGSKRGMNLFAEADRLPLNKKTEMVKRAWQEQIPRLLIFDNCEDINVAAEWLPVSGGCSALITSRRSDWSKTLPLTVCPLEILPRPESVTFLQYLAEALSLQEADMVAQEVGDWPLALQLAGSFLYRYQDVIPQEYVAQLREKRLLQHDSLKGRHARYSPTGHDFNVAHTFALSFDKLDMNDPVDVAAQRLMAKAASLAPNEPIPLSLLFDSTSNDDPSVDKPIEAAAARLLSLGFLNAINDEIVTMHNLLVTFTIDWLAGESVLTEAKLAVEQALIRQIDPHKAAVGSLATLPFSPVHLRFVTTRAVESDDQQAFRFVNLMSAYLLAIANYEEAESYLEIAFELSKTRCGEESLEMAATATLQGNLYQAKGQYKETEPYYLKALAIHKELLGDNHLETANSLNNVGAIRLRIGPYHTAAPYLEQALAIRERLLGPDHSLTLSILNNLGVMHNFIGEPDLARPYFEKVLAVRERTLGPEHLLTATSLNNLGDLLARNGEEKAGRPFMERATAIREKQLGADHPLTLASKTNLGLALSRIDEFEAAEKHLEQALAAAVPKIGKNHPLTARILNTLGILFTKTGRYDEALTYLEQALTIREKVRGLVHPDTAYSLICLGEVYLARNESENGRPYFERAMTILEQTVEPTAPEYLRVKQYLSQKS
ncbi:MAG: FxSxx-COOH system tetratricopeptide repeat protein [Candidatus Promineifilaceae bacterium]